MREAVRYSKDEWARKRLEETEKNIEMNENLKIMKRLTRIKEAVFIFDVLYILFLFIGIVGAVMSLSLDFIMHIIFMLPVVAISFLGVVYKTKQSLFRAILLPCIFLTLISTFVAEGIFISFLICSIQDVIYYFISGIESELAKEPGYPYFIQGIEERFESKEYIAENKFNYDHSIVDDSIDVEKIEEQHISEVEEKIEKSFEMESVEIPEIV